MNRVTQERLRELLDYDPATGIFTWRVTRNRNAIAGSIAGTPDSGYIKIWIDCRQYRAHQLAWFYVHGEWVREIDHKNRIKSDTRLANLRPATRKHNSENRGLQRNNTSGVRGVTWNKKERKWSAQIRHNKRQMHLGWHGRFEDAVAARLSAEQRLFTHSDACR